MPVTLGGPTARKVIRRADMVCAFHYIGPDQEESACFYALHRRKVGGIGAYVVPLSTAHEYTDQRRLFEAATKAAEIMGFDPYSKTDVHKIMEFIEDMLIELLTMQPAPATLNPTPEPLEVTADGNRINVVIH